MNSKILKLLTLTLLVITVNACSMTTESGTDKIQFDTKTISGQPIESNIFKDKKVTMVNVWTTWCGSCIEEMPELQALYEELKEQDVNIIGIVADTPDKEREKLAQEIVEKKEVKFDNIIPDDTLKNNLLEEITAFPTTFFVDSDGNLIGATFIGQSDYKKEIMRLLENRKENK